MDQADSPEPQAKEVRDMEINSNMEEVERVLEGRQDITEIAWMQIYSI